MLYLLLVFPQYFYYFLCLLCDLIHIDLLAPNNVRATVLSHSNVEVTWDQLSDATEYTISYSTTASHFRSGSITVKGGTTTSHILEHLEGSTQYNITVQATTSSSRKSAISSEVSVVTHAAGKSYA